ncbi:MAG: D-arabinono-1,4-lactone oxidase [Bacteroidota bacterium]
MDKRTFLKTSSAFVAGSMLSPLISCQTDETQAMEQIAARTNWAGNLTYSTQVLHEPTTVAEVQALIKQHDKLRMLGTRHCFNKIADSKVRQVSMAKLNQEMTIDEAAMTVSVGPGVRYGELSVFLHEKGYAVHNLASLPHISVAGACSTATHGSGNENGNLSSAVAALEFVDGNGELQQLSRDKNGETFLGAVVGLGGVGAITKVTLDILPTFLVQQDIYLNLPLQEVLDNFDAVTGAGYSVSFFTDYQKDEINQVWIKRVADPANPIQADPEWFGGKLQDRNVHPIITLGAENCTDQMGVPGPWYDRLPHFKMGFTPSSGKELQSEYFVPRQHAVEAIKAVQKLGPQLTEQLMISEIRMIAADKFWISPCYQQDSVAIHFTWEQNETEVRKLMSIIERELTPFGVKPHWGKIFNFEPEVLQPRYEKLEDFRALLAQFDPKGKFRNAFLDRHVF